jgi:hypothetical protein
MEAERRICDPGHGKLERLSLSCPRCSTKELIMTANIGDFDRVVRILAGLAILSLVFFFDGPNRWWALVGFVPLLTGLVRWCPAYLPFGISTRKTCCSA